MNNIERKALIVESIEKHLAAGNILICKGYYRITEDGKDCRCPLSCLTQKHSDAVIATAYQMLEADKTWVSDFINGFDDNPEYTTNEAFYIGKELRERFNPECVVRMYDGKSWTWK